MNTYMTTNGRVVIPAKIRKKMGLKEDTPVYVHLNEQTRQIILTPITREFVHNLRGRYKGTGLLRALMVGKKQA